MEAISAQTTIVSKKSVGREKELQTLSRQIDHSLQGNGRLVLVSGEMGVGKTQLIQELKDYATSTNFGYLEGRCMYHDETVPFLPFLTAFGGVTDEKIILTSKTEKAHLHDVFLIHKSGLLICHRTRETGEEDEDIVAGMLTAVQNFISDSFVDDEEERQKLIDEALTRLADTKRTKVEEKKVGDVIAGTGMFVRDAFAENALAKGLGRLEYGDTIILIEHGENVFSAGVVYGKDTPSIKEDLKRMVDDVEAKYGTILKDWEGRVSDMQDLGGMLEQLTVKEYNIKGRMDERLLGMERTRMFQHVLDIMESMAEKRPIMFFLDDLQWADSGTLHLIHYLARNIRDDRVLMVGAYRPEEATSLLEDALHRMEAEGIYEEVVLGNLPPMIIGNLVSSTYKGLSLSDESLQTVYKETEGNPFYTLEVLKNLEDEGVIYKKDGIWGAKELTGVYIPKSISDVVERRINRLGKNELEALVPSSVLGLTIEFELLGELVKMDEDELVDTLDGLVKDGVLTEVPGDEFIFRFSQAAVQQVLYNQLTKLKRSVMHKKAADTIERLREDRIDDYAPALIKHYKETKKHDKTAYYGELGGDKAGEVNSHEEAVGLYQIALEALEKTDAEQENIERLHLKIYDASYTIGDWERAKANALSLLKIANAYTAKGKQEIGERKASKARRLLAEILVYQNQCDEAQSILEWVLEKSEEPVARSEGHFGIGRIHYRKGDLDMAMFSFEQALLEAGKAGALGLTAKITNDMGIVYDAMGEYEMSIQYKKKALAAMLDIGDKYEIGRAFNNLGVTYMYKGDGDSSLENLEQAIQIYKEIENAEGLAYSLSNAAEEYVLKGDLDKAEKYVKKAMPILMRTGDKIMIANTHMVYGMIHHKRQAWDMANFEFQTAIDMAKKLDIPQLLGIIYMQFGRMLVSQGKKDQAKNIFEEALAIWRELGNSPSIADTQVELEKLA